MERRPPWALSWHIILTWTDKEPNFHKRRFFCTTLLAPRLKRKNVKGEKRKHVKGEKRKRETKKEKEGIKNR